MRIILIITAVLLIFSAELSAQNDFKTLNEETWNFYKKGDYKNLRKTADSLLLNGTDYYYLRMRLGVLAYNKQLYSSALRDLSRAIEFNSLDTISRELIYNSYLFSGRKADAILYLESLSTDKRNSALKASVRPVSSEFYVSTSASAYNVVLYETNSLNYEAVKSSLSTTAGVETYFLNKFKATIAYTNYYKSGIEYSPINTSGKDLNFTQNQFYGKLSGYIFPGWEISGFGHATFYSEAVIQGHPGNIISVNQLVSEFLGGVGITKNGWKIRASVNLSVSNLGHSNQMRSEGYLTLLPSGNLNLYLTLGGMGQTDINWGRTYQINQEIGFKILKSLWMESGVIEGNSFLYGRNQGFMLNNSFQIPATTIYSNIIILPWKHFRILLTPYYVGNDVYSWDLINYTRTSKLNINTFGGSIKLIYKN